MQSGFKKCESEKTLYKKKQGDGLVLACLYVDDIMYMWSSQILVDEFKCEMMKAFEMTNLGVLHYFLELEIKQGIDGVFVSQCKYAEDLFKRLCMQGCEKQ